MDGRTETGGMRRTALVVEDNEKILKGLTRGLEIRGYCVTSMLYRADVDVPRVTKFDLAIVDGLEGDCFEF